MTEKLQPAENGEDSCEVAAEETLLGNKNNEQYETFEDILEKIGPIGLWQFLLYGCLSWSLLWGSMLNFGVIYYQITPEFACDVMPNSNWTLGQIRAFSSPTIEGSDQLFDACLYYPRNYSSFEATSFSTAIKGQTNTSQSEMATKRCEKFVFNRTTNMRSTMVTQFILVCGRKYLVEHSQFAFAVGQLIGALVGGAMADRFGRRVIFCIGAMAIGISGLGQAVALTYSIFITFRFFVAAFLVFTQVAAYCLVAETTTASVRSWVGGLLFLPFAIGYPLLSVLAFVLRDWQTVFLVAAAPFILTTTFWWCITESPRWLLQRGRTQDANRALMKANWLNGGRLPADFHLTSLADSIGTDKQAEAQKRGNFLDIFEMDNCRFIHGSMVCRVAIVCFVWFAHVLVYYGLALNASSLGGSVFVNNLMAGLVETPSYLICVPLLSWGRRRSLVSLLVLAAVCLFVSPLLPAATPSMVGVGFAMVGKLLITTSWAVLFTMTPELYPTCMRSSAMAVSSSVGRFGSMLAPYISTGVAKADPSLSWLPMIIFGACSLVAGVLALCLPETKGKSLPERLDDIEAPRRPQERKSVAAPVERVFLRRLLHSTVES